MTKEQALKIVLDFVERWNKQDKEAEVAEAARVLSLENTTQNDEIKRKIEEIFDTPQYVLNSEKCPFCSFEVPINKRDKNKRISMALHLKRMHPDKCPTKVEKLLALYTEMVEGELETLVKSFRKWEPLFPNSEPESVIMAQGYNLCLHEMEEKLKQYLLERNKK